MKTLRHPTMAGDTAWPPQPLDERQMRYVVELLDLYGDQPESAKSLLDALCEGGALSCRQRQAVRILFLLPVNEVDDVLRLVCESEEAKRVYEALRERLTANREQLWRSRKEASMRRTGVTYELHHIGIPITEVQPGARFAAKAGMYTTDDLSGPVPIQWHRFGPNSPLHPLLRTQPHVAYKVSDLAPAIEGHAVILGPYAPIDDYHVAVIDNAGVPVELIETTLSDEEIWGRARTRMKASLYGTAGTGQP